MALKKAARAKYKEGDKVWLAEFREGKKLVAPRVKATILTVDVMPWGISYVVEVDPEDDRDDGMRELTEHQIEGKQ